jgi:hypothetical protein
MQGRDMRIKKKNVVQNQVITYKTLEQDGFDHFQISVLAIHLAADHIRSGKYLEDIQKGYKPKVAMIALHELSSKPGFAKKYKEQLMLKKFEEEQVQDNYDVSAGHLPCDWIDQDNVKRQY